MATKAKNATQQKNVVGKSAKGAIAKGATTKNATSRPKGATTTTAAAPNGAIAGTGKSTGMGLKKDVTSAKEKTANATG